MSMPDSIDTAIVGAGQAGLTMSWHLRQAGTDHVLLERRSTLGGGWQDRWDRFCLVTPNWSASLAGYPYDGADPDGFMPRDEIRARIAEYAARIDAPVMVDAGVHRLASTLRRFELETAKGPIRAGRVVVAAGPYQVPRIPPVASTLPARIVQLHSHQYRNETQLPPGAVLVVGSGQSGVQIAEELADAGRRVLLSVGSAGRIPRRYRGRDVFSWLAAVMNDGSAYGVALPTVDRLPDPRIPFMGNPHLSGQRGGHDTNLRRFAADGMTLLGRISRVEGERLELADDLSANLARADAFFGQGFQPLIDRYIELAEIDAPPDDRAVFDYEPISPSELDLAAEGVSAVIWATGYDLDLSWIDLPIFGERGTPRHRRGVTDVPGLYFLGLHWQHHQPSGTLFGVGGDAQYLAERMAAARNAGSD